MTADNSIEEKYRKAAELIARAGVVPFNVTNTLVDIVKYYIDESDAEFIIKNFSAKTTLSADEIRLTSGMSDNDIRKKNGFSCKKRDYIQPA